MNRDDRQRAVLKWVGDTFGEESLAPMERVLRVLEEAVELVQAEGMTRDRARAVVEYVFNKPPGEPVQEVGGLSVTLIAYCESRGILADAEEQREFDRVLAVDPEHFRARHDKKADAGIAVRSTARETLRATLTPWREEHEKHARVVIGCPFCEGGVT